MAAGASLRQKHCANIHCARRQTPDAATCVASGAGRRREHGQACQSTYVAAQLRYAHGGERSGSKDGADDPWPCGYFDDAGLYAPGAGPTEECAPRAPSEREEEAACRARVAGSE